MAFMTDDIKPGVTEIADHLYRITLPMPFRLEHVSVYALLEGPSVSLFDTGGNFPGTFPVFERLLKDIGRAVSDVRQIFVTHYHADHCGIAGLIKEQSRGTIFMSEIDFDTIRSFEQEDLRLQRFTLFCKEQGLDPKTVRMIAGLFKTFKGITAPFQADRFLKDGEEMSINGKTVKVLATPGHTRGHFSFFIPEEGILIGGDHILPHITPNLSPDLLSSEFRALRSFMASLDKIARLPVREVYPAHGASFPDLKARVEEIRAHHRERKAIALEALKARPKTTAEVSVDIFGSDLPEFDKLLALNETYVHLVELEDESTIRRYREGEAFLFTLD
jgi:glyoxylase-like metal-dependent hydrolase (beta-lactamase superfamily II)